MTLKVKVALVVALVALLGIGVAVGPSLGQGGVKVTFWHAMGKAHAPILEKLVGDFMAANPDVTVELVYQGGYGSLSQKLTTALAEGHPPTMAQMYENWTTQWMLYLLPLESFLDPGLIADLLPALRDGNTYVLSRYLRPEEIATLPDWIKERADEPVLYTVPFNKSVIVLYYNADLIPTPPANWEEFLQVAKENTKDTDGDGQIDFYGTGLRPAPNPEIFLTFLAQNEGSILNEDWTEVTLNNQAGLETAKYVDELKDYALITSDYLSDHMGQIALFIDTSAGWPYNKSAADRAGFTLKVARVPAHKNRKSMIQGTNLGIFTLNTTQAEQQAAIRLIKFLLRPENIVYWAKESGYLPVTQSAISSDEWQQFMAANPERVAMTEQMFEGFVQLLHPRYWDIREILSTMFEQLCMDVLEPKEALDQAAAAIAELIAAP
ncbi:MAG: ABC transporter substrate-binding protein [Candidatus Bipolaricaulia bacterium]